MLYTLNLPKPSDALIELTRKHAYAKPINYDALKWHESIQGPEVNCAPGNFFDVPEVTLQALKEYQQFFKHKLYPTIGIITNTKNDIPACYPPHTDRVRTASVNFYIDTGGDNVCTVFYDKHDPINGKVEGRVLPYSELQPTSQYQFDNSTWYVVNTQQFHSVENILTSRCMLTLSLIDCTVDELLVSVLGFEPRPLGPKPSTLPDNALQR